MSLVNEILELVAPYYAAADKAHQIDHAHDVWEECARMAKMYPDQCSEKVLFLAAYTHDIFTLADRENHHTLAKEYLLAKDFTLADYYTEEELYSAAMAVESHRASWKGDYYDMNGRILAAADRGGLDYPSRLRRSFQYGLTKLGLSDKEAAAHAFHHMHEKFHPVTGYSKRDEFYKSVYSEQLAQFDALLASTTLEDAEEMLLANA